MSGGEPGNEASTILCLLQADKLNACFPWKQVNNTLFCSFLSAAIIQDTYIMLICLFS